MDTYVKYKTNRVDVGRICTEFRVFSRYEIQTLHEEALELRMYKDHLKLQ